VRIAIVSVVGLCILLVSSVSRSEESIQGVVGCQCAPSDFTTTNKEVVRQWFSALDAQDFGALTNLMDEQFVVPARKIEGADRAVGRNETFELIRRVYRSFPDYTHDIEEMIAEGDRVAVKVVLRGTQLGDYSRVPPTGRQVSYAGTYMVTVIDGVLTEVWSLDDEINLLSQLGMELVPISQSR
jgi:predicted ester cyclase